MFFNVGNPIFTHADGRATTYSISEDAGVYYAYRQTTYPDGRVRVHRADLTQVDRVLSPGIFEPWNGPEVQLPESIWIEVSA